MNIYMRVKRYFIWRQERKKIRAKLARLAKLGIKKIPTK
jgi:hypothetical protein